MLLETLGIMIPNDVFLCFMLNNRRRSDWSNHRFVEGSAKCSRKTIFHFLSQNFDCQITRYQIHQCSTSSFCGHRSQKCIKGSQVVNLFCAFGICMRKLFLERWWNWPLVTPLHHLMATTKARSFYRLEQWCQKDLLASHICSYTDAEMSILYFCFLDA